jgi:autotransporter-associated beta strand protein
MKQHPPTHLSEGKGSRLFKASVLFSPRLFFLLPALALLPGAHAHAANGLTGQYYDTAAFGTLKTTRTDATVNFDWGTAIPSGTALTSADTFSVAWAGQLEPEFSQRYTFYVTADDGARLWVNDQLVALRTFNAAPSELRGQILLKAGERVNLRLEYIEQTGSAKVKLEWSCGSRAREVIPTERLSSARVEKAGGALLQEHWQGLAGDAISSLTSNANYPNKPSGRAFITSFECLAQDWTNAYGTRVTGYLVPPVSGSYTFAVSGDDTAELYLSTDATTNNKALIASVSAATGYRVWDAQPSQQSGARTLTQGQRYYVELLHKENTGSDHWSVGWRCPGDTAFSVVPGSALVQPGLNTAQPSETALLNTLAQEHPRLFATAERFAKLRATWQSATPSQPKTWAQNAINSANTILTQAPVTYSPDVRGTILDDSRTAVDRLYKLGLAWQLTGGSPYAERAWTELSTVAAFPDWHPAHFLDTAEMTHACAIGYDWLYHYWTPARRDTIRNAIITFGLNAGLSQYTSNAGWSKSTGNNWNMVCNGGLSMGALAVGAESESLVENILNRALNSTRPVWRHFTTDNGAWYEGPGYYGYTTEYGIRMLAALECSLGSDFGISATTNLSESGFAPILALGTSGKVFNYADAGAGGALRGPVFQWFARRYNQPLFNSWENQGGGGALDALWWDDRVASLTDLGAPPDMAFHGEAGTAFQPQEMVTFRGNWTDSRATFIGCKGGEMGASHGNLDAGTFVLDALGKRWFHDLGGDDYALPGYFSTTPSSGTDRWDYYRMRPEGQNTLTINPSANADMVLNAVAPLVACQSEADGSGSFAIHDLTPVYSGMTRVWRGTRLLGSRDELLVQDEIQSSTGKTVWWFAHYSYPTTAVEIEPGGTSAMMTQGADRLWCKIVGEGGTFQIMDAVPLPTSPDPAGQNANAGFKKLAIHLTNVTNTTLAVWFVPLESGEPVPDTLPTLTALNTWNLATANDAPVVANGNATDNGENAVDIDLRAYVSDDFTPPELMRFSVGASVNGTVVLLADGHTARFTPTPGYTGVPAFDVVATDAGPDPRTVLIYDFERPDASATNTAPDGSGLGRDGTFDVIGTGSATLQTNIAVAFAREGRSLDLAENGGANAARLSRVLATSEITFNTDDWTITGWFRRRDNANEDMLWHLNSGDGFGSNEELYLMAHGASSLSLSHFPGPDVSIVSNGVTAGVWHHFAVTRNGATLSLYLNGVLVGSDDTFTLAINQTYPLIFGGHMDTSATYAPRWLDGGLDELAVFRAALTPSEIAELAEGMTVRHLGGLSATGTITLAAAPANHVWTNALTGLSLPWSTAANWSDNQAPVSSRGAEVRFFTGQPLAGGAITSRNDLAGDFVLNRLTLDGTASAATSATVTGGRLTFLKNGTLAPFVTLGAEAGSGLTYDVAAPVTLGDDTTFDCIGSGILRFSGPIEGEAGLIKTSNKSLVLSGANTYGGNTVISAGTLQIGADGATGTLGAGPIINNGQLRFDRTGTLAVPNSISGSGNLYLDCPIHAGTLVLSGTNSFTGTVTVNSGMLRISNSSALGTGNKTITLSNGTVGAPQLRLDGSAAPIELPRAISFRTSSATGALINEAGSNTLSGDITLTGGGGDTKILVSAGTLTLIGALAPNTTSRTLQLAGAGTGISTGSISNGVGVQVLNVSKSDAGTWLLAGTNTYTGTTSINAGTLALGNASALGHGGANIGSSYGFSSVSSGATLDLNGQTGVNEVLTVRGTGVGGNGGLVNSSGNPASLAGGVISAVAVTAGGTHSELPVVSFSGPGTGAAATAALGVTAASFAIDGGTTVYSSAPSVTISGGGGSGATATALLTGGVVSGMTVTSAGTGYTNAPSLAFTGGTVTTAGTNPTGTGNALNFTVSGITVTDPGTGYTSAPTVTFGSGTGTAATAYLSSVTLAANTSMGGAGDILLEAPVSGPYALTKVGTGGLTLSGTNTYTGATTVSAGTLVLQGSLTSHVTVAAGTLKPSGASSTTGNLALNSGGHLAVRLEGPAGGSQADQLTVGGSVTLAGELDVTAGTNLPPGSAFTLINKSGAGAVSGTFAGKADNSTFTAGGYIWRIAYTGGTGNDVVLSVVNVSTFTNIWNNVTTGSTLAWTTDANWQTGTAALSSPDGTVEFLTGQTLAAGTVTANNDNAGTFQLSTLRLAGDGPASGTATVALRGNALGLGAGDASPAIKLDAHAGDGGALTYSVSNVFTLAKLTAVEGSGTSSFALEGPIQGEGGLTKSGSAALTLSGANTYSGGTTLGSNAGTVQAHVSATRNALGTGPVAIGTGTTLRVENSNTSAATVAVTNAFSGSGLLSLYFATNALARSTALSGLSGFAGTIQLTSAGGSGDKWDASGVDAPGAGVQIDGGNTLALASSSATFRSLTFSSVEAYLTNTVLIGSAQTLSVGGAEGLLVGTDSGTSSTTKCRMSGGGTLAVTNPSAHVLVGKAQASQNYSNNSTLDLSGLSGVIFGTAACPINELRVGYGLTSAGLLTLPNTSAVIAAKVLQIGHSNGGNPGPGTVILGAGVNILSAGTVNIGLSKAVGTLKFASRAAGSSGTVSISGTNGVPADFVIGSKNGTGTSATPTGTLDLRGHTASVSAGSLTLGKEDSNTTVYQGGAAGYLYFDGGTFTASNMTMATKILACPSAATAVLTVSGGVFTVTSGGSCTLASQSGAGSASGTLNLNGGTFRTYADIRDGGGTATSTLLLDGGTLDLTGHAIGSTSQRVDMVQLRSGTLMNLGQLNNGEPLVKTGSGTLSLAGTNTYSGATVVSNGIFRLTGPACLPPSNTLYLVTGAVADLAFMGTQTVHAVFINGTPKSAGIYGPGNLPPYLTGSGFLKTEWPPSPRTMFLIR